MGVHLSFVKFACLKVFCWDFPPLEPTIQQTIDGTIPDYIYRYCRMIKVIAILKNLILMWIIKYYQVKPRLSPAINFCDVNF